MKILKFFIFHLQDLDYHCLGELIRVINEFDVIGELRDWWAALETQLAMAWVSHPITLRFPHCALGSGPTRVPCSSWISGFICCHRFWGDLAAWGPSHASGWGISAGYRLKMRSQVLMKQSWSVKAEWQTFPGIFDDCAQENVENRPNHIFIADWGQPTHQKSQKLSPPQENCFP